MTKLIHNERGFTLIEMMIVLLIISILLMIAVPAMTKSNSVASQKTCEATKQLLQSQAAAYTLEHDGQEPKTIGDLAKYVENIDSHQTSNTGYTCPNGKVLVLSDQGEVIYKNGSGSTKQSG